MMPDFTIPESWEDVGKFCASVGPGDAGEDKFEDLVDELKSEATAVAIPATFATVYRIVRRSGDLSPTQTFRLLDVLVANLSAVSMALGQSSASTADAVTGNCLRMYAMFSLRLLEANLDKPDALVKGAAKTKKKALPTTWDASAAWKKVLSSFALTAGTLSAASHDDAGYSDLIRLLTRTVGKALEDGAVVKANSEAINRILAACAARGALEDVTSVAVTLLHKHEHVASQLAELAELCERTHGDMRLPQQLLHELLVNVDPAQYKDLAQRQSGGVAFVARFLAELAERCPTFVEKTIALLMPHMAGPHQMRSAIVTAVGIIIIRSQAAAAGADSAGAHARLVTKQNLLQLLMDRVHDASAFTRARAVQTWTNMAEHSAIPISHWCRVAQLAVGRLQDKAILVRKAALKHLLAMLAKNPFGPTLDLECFAETLRVYTRRLERLEAQAGDTGVDGPAWSLGELTLSEGEELLTQLPAGSLAGDSEDKENQQAPPGQQAASDAKPPAKDELAGSGCRNVMELRVLVASLSSAVDFTQCLQGALPYLNRLLASSAASDVQETIALLKYMKHMGIAAADEPLHKMLALIFAKEQATCAAVQDAFVDLYIDQDSATATAHSLTTLLTGTLGTAASVQQILSALLQQDALHDAPSLVRALLALTHQGAAAVDDAGRQRAQAALQLVSMLACERPRLLRGLAPEVLRISFRSALAREAPLLQKWALDSVTALAASDETAAEVQHREVLSIIVEVLMSQSSSPSWHMLAQSAVKALYAMHPQPGSIVFPLLHALCTTAMAPAPLCAGKPLADGQASESTRSAHSVLHASAPDEADACETADSQSPDENAVPEPSDAAAVGCDVADDEADCSEGPVDGGSDEAGRGPAQQAAGVQELCDGVERLPAEGPRSAAVSQPALSRLFTVIGQVTMQHLCHVEARLMALRKQEVDAGKAAGGQPGPEGKDELENVAPGDADVTQLQDAVDAQLKQQLLPYSTLVRRFCHSGALLEAAPLLQASALLALCNTMCISADGCDSCLQLVFSLLTKRVVGPEIRNNLVLAMGDLLLKWPNTMEPWTGHMYAVLNDPDTSVRINTLMVLSHLILNDMMKVKGHISKVCLCLQDPEPQVVAMAETLFDELSKRVHKGSNPIYNLLPDILSTLSADASLPAKQFRAIMAFLLKYIQKDKHIEHLVEKLLLRFDADMGVWAARNLAFCVQQLRMDDKGVRCLQQHLSRYRPFLADEEVLDLVQRTIQAARTCTKDPVRQKEVEDFASQLSTIASELLGKPEGDDAAQGEDGSDTVMDCGSVKVES